MRMTDRARLLIGASLAGLVLAAPAHAQSRAAAARALGLPDLPASVAAGVAARAVAPVSIVRDPSGAVTRQTALQARLAGALGLATQAQVAARNAAAVGVVPNGLVAGGLVLAPGARPVAADATGLATLDGANAPTQTVAGRQTTVTVTQTASRAIVSWQSFNVGVQTTLNFEQRVGGVAQPDWVVFNRVTGGLDPATGVRTAGASPSQILGRITGDATVILVNPAGVFFSNTAQVRAGSLLVSTLNFGGQNRPPELQAPGLVGPITFAERNILFVRNGVPLFLESTNTLNPDPDARPRVILDAVEGDIRVAPGARLATGEAGTLLLAAPRVLNGGTLTASAGSVLLAAGRTITLNASSGAGDGALQDIRGLFIAATQTTGTTSGAFVQNTGVIESPRGYVGLRSDDGAIFQSGVITSTTSVSRNGFVDLVAPDVQLGRGSTIAITPDGDGETIPQSPESVASFRTSRLRVAGGTGNVSRVEVAADALVYAPGGRVELGGGTVAPSRVFVDAGATIDVGGIKDLELPASRNGVVIGPAKRNDLRDTPLYREGLTPDEQAAQARGETVRFTLNGAVLYLDPRRSGVRADGTRWVGSPLVEAESVFQQTGVTAAELLTRGGQITLASSPYNEGAPLATLGDVIVKPGATLDVSGGFVRYAAGEVRTSQLITRSGTTVDIGNADPNGDYVGLINPFTQVNSRFGQTQSFTNGTLLGTRQAAGYIEGRDAGALRVAAAALALDGRVFAEAYAGAVQRTDAARGTAAPTLAGDPRRLQASRFELPSGGWLAVTGPLSGARTTGDIAVTTAGAITPVAAALGYGQSPTIGADGALLRTDRPESARLPEGRRTTIQLADGALTSMGLGGLTLEGSGAITFAPGSFTALAPGAAVELTAGRRINLGGTLLAASGSIAATTQSVNGFNIIPTRPQFGSAFADDPLGVGSFDITVAGTLSVAGRFVNDFGAPLDAGEGGAFTAGGSITLTSAPRVALVSALVQAPTTTVLDVSGSIRIAPGARLDLAGGAYVGPIGAIATTARGGDLALVNDTTYAQLGPNTNADPLSAITINFRRAPGVDVVAFTPPAINSVVSIAPGTVDAHGFAGGGTFTLATPALTTGSGPVAVGTALPLDFVQRAGFAAADIRVLATRILPNRLVDAGGGTTGGFNALLDTTVVRLNAGDTLDLTQTRFNPQLTTAQVLGLQALPTGGALASVLTPGVDPVAFDQRPISLAYSGLVELDIAAGARVTGAGGAALSATRIAQAGSIRLPGGTVTATGTLPAGYFTQGSTIGLGVGIRALSDAFTIRADGRIVEGDRSALDPARTNVNVASTTPLFFLGGLAQGDGLRAAAGSVTDVSGSAFIDPRALRLGAPTIDGRLLAGGTITTLPVTFDAPGGAGAARNAIVGETATPPTLLVAAPGSTINVSGANATFDRIGPGGFFVPTPLASEGGLLGLRGGGSIAGATVLAAGGSTQVEGGTLIVRDLRLTPTAASGGAVAADQIVASGFDTLVAEGSFGGEGTLALRRAFFVQSVPLLSAVADEALYGVRIGATGPLQISAPIIRLASIAQAIPDIARGVAPGTATATFSANALDVAGAVLFDASLAATTLRSATDIRFIGAQPLVFTTGATTAAVVQPSLVGRLQTRGDLTLAAAQVFPTTGTTFTVASSAPTGTITVTQVGATPGTPYSAGTDLTVQAATIAQNGTVRAPLGTLRLGSTTAAVNAAGQTTAPATTRLTLGAGGTTSVSADGLRIPYGTSTDQNELFFTPTVGAELAAPPAGVLRLGGATITIAAGATVNLAGGGDVYAYEFIPGVGGSRDVLSRFNADAFSSNGGLAYADGRQVFAVVPSLRDAGLATVDPILAADYGALLSAPGVGRRVYLEGAPGLEPGWYTLLPAQYALLPGGLRVVEQPEYGQRIPGQSVALNDGTQVVGGYFGTAGTDLRESERRVFTVQSQPVFRQFSQIETTPLTATFAARAARNGLVAPRSPVDAGRLVIDAITGLSAEGTLLTAAAPGGRAGAVDLRGTNFLIGAAPAGGAPTGTIVIAADTLNRLAGASLLIGAERTDNADGTTDLAVTARTITLGGGAALSGPELLFAVDGSGSAIRFLDGASATATGAVADTRDGDYRVTGGVGGATGAGAFVRLSTGPERRLTRAGVATVATAPLIAVGAATLSAPALLLDSSGGVTIVSGPGGAATLTATTLGVGANAINFTGAPGTPGLVVTPELAAAFGGAAALTLRSATPLGFAPGDYGFGVLTIDAPALALLPGSGGGGGSVAITAGALRLQNSARAVAGCAPACGTGTLAVGAQSITFGSGGVTALGFGGGVALTAPGGVFFEGGDNTVNANGIAGLDAGNAPFVVATPFLGDRAPPLRPGQPALQPRLALTTTGDLTIAGSGPAAAAPAGTPGARLVLGGANVTIRDTRVVATAGALDVTAAGTITVAGSATIAAPGFARVFGDASDPYTLNAPGGIVRLSAGTGGITLGARTLIDVGGAAGNAGELRIVAANGVVDAAGAFNGAAPGGGGAFYLRSDGAFDLGRFAAGSAAGFTRFIDIRAGAGDLALGAGGTLRSGAVTLAADGGAVAIAGTIDTGGAVGGDIALFGRGGVTLASTGLLSARASGYGADDSRQAHGGAVTLGTDGTGAITLAAGSRVDVSAARPGDRLIAETRLGGTVYRFAAGDTGGTLRLRAPLLVGAGGGRVNATAAGTVAGASEVTVEAFRRYDLATVAADPTLTGVTLVSGVAVLNPAQVAAGRANFLAAESAGTVARFVQSFDLAGQGTTLAGLGAYTAQPGIELVHTGGIRLASDWNLGAGTVDVAGAVAAGLMRANPALPGAFYVVPGQEAAVFARFTRLTFRVGGRVDGAPGRLALRAGGTLDLAASLTDGLFAFRDRTTPNAISYAFGGGAREVRAVVNADCPIGLCELVQEFTPGYTPLVFASPRTGLPLDASGITIDFSTPLGGATNLIPPDYAAAANRPFTSGGDPLGTAELFPLLDTPAGPRAVRSWGYTLVGGADLATPSGAPSADPAAVSGNAGVIVRGERAYALNPSGGPQVLGSGPLSAVDTSASNQDLTAITTAASLAEFATEFARNNTPASGDFTITTNAATTLRLSGPGGVDDPLTALLNARAAAFFTDPATAIVTPDDGSGVALVSTTLTLAGAFLQLVAADYAAALVGAAPIDPLTGAPLDSSPTLSPFSPVNFVRTRIRTGTGGITVAAAGSIDLSGGAVVNRTTAGAPVTPVQVGGAAIYTVGARAPLAAARATTADGATRTVTPTATAPDAALFAQDGRYLLRTDALPVEPVYLAGGGAVTLTAGGAITGRRDVAGNFRDVGGAAATFIGGGNLPYRVGQIGRATDARVNPALFQTGVGTLGGGDINVTAGTTLTDLDIVANTSLATASVTGAGAPTVALVTLGGGLVRVGTGGDLVSARLDAGAGAIDARVRGSVTTLGVVTEIANGAANAVSNATRVRVADATARVAALGSAVFATDTQRGSNATPITGFDPERRSSLRGAAFAPVVSNVAGAGASGVASVAELNDNGNAFFSPTAALDLVAGGPLLFGALAPGAPGFGPAIILPGTFQAASLTGDLTLAPAQLGPLVLVPSPVGQLRLFAGNRLAPVAVAMDDSDPGAVPGYFSIYATDNAGNAVVEGAARALNFPAVLSTTTDRQRRQLHNAAPTHAADPEPVRVFAGGDIDTLRLSTPKQTRVGAGRDLIDAAVFAQNLAATDVTRVTAGRDIVATNTLATPDGATAGAQLPLARGNTFVIGGPGAFSLEAGRDIGPFLPSVVATAVGGQGPQTLGGGVLSVGNEWNPWLRPEGANVTVAFGVGPGVDYAALRDVYVDPANIPNLPDELFVNAVDSFGRFTADRAQPIYPPLLIAWTRANAAAELTAAFGTTDVTAAQAYTVFKALPPLRQRPFLIGTVYFGELRAASIPGTVSSGRFSRGYRAVNTLFPPTAGYTANDLTGGGAGATALVATGDLDLRLATIQTARGGDVTLLGPGGRVLGGSVVRTDQQAARRLTVAERVYDGFLGARTNPNDTQVGPLPARIEAIPSGFEGLLTLRGGAINGFVDRNLLLNQSRLFTQGGGSVTLFSANGDLNAGLGPRTSANFPPVVVRVGPNLTVEVDAVGGVTGAGIAAFQPAPGVPAPDVFLIAPRGTVDAGDAGVRVAGNLFVAALQVANADNFTVGGSAFGIPSGPVVNVGAATAAGAQSAAAQQVANAVAGDSARRRIDPLSRIIVDVLGAYGDTDRCRREPRPRDCPAPTP